MQKVQNNYLITSKQSGAVLVETTIALGIFMVLVFTGLFYGNFINTQAVMEAAARNASRSLATFNPTNNAPAGSVFSDAEYLDFAAQGIAVARRYMEIAGYDPEHFSYRVSSFAVPNGGAIGGREPLINNYEQIEVAIANQNLHLFEPRLCARSVFKYEVPLIVAHYTTVVTEDC